jgi:glyoxylase-like metal-dependent hydrolase (beta-lactamase superfamily II)
MRHPILGLTSFALGLGLAGPVARSATPVVHTVTASEQGLAVNGYLIEGARRLVAIDSALTVTDARKVRARAEALGKPLAAVLLTHGHPDHYNGLATLIEGKVVPVYATAAVARVIREHDAAKEKQWKPVFGAEWPARRAFPDHEVRGGQKVVLDEMTFVAHDVGPGESHADSWWELRGPAPAAFIGDLVLHQMHAYTSDGHTGAWLANLARLQKVLAGFGRLYPGHGPPGDQALLAWQARYLETYRGHVDRLRAGGAALDAARKRSLVAAMKAAYPGAGGEFLIELGADAVAAELAGKR